MNKTAQIKHPHRRLKTDDLRAGGVIHPPIFPALLNRHDTQRFGLRFTQDKEVCRSGCAPPGKPGPFLMWRYSTAPEPGVRKWAPQKSSQVEKVAAFRWHTVSAGPETSYSPVSPERNASRHPYTRSTPGLPRYRCGTGRRAPGGDTGWLPWQPVETGILASAYNMIVPHGLKLILFG